jgi:transposase
MLPEGVPIFVATEGVDMRLGFERLGGLVREKMQQDPRRRALFVFIGKRRQSLKILSWDGSGVLLLYKRLDQGLFEMPRGEGPHVVLSDALLRVLFAGTRAETSVRNIH